MRGIYNLLSNEQCELVFIAISYKSRLLKSQFKCKNKMLGMELIHFVFRSCVGPTRVSVSGLLADVTLHLRPWRIFTV